MAKERRIITGDNTPIKTYYQFKAPETPNEKYNVQVLEKGQEIKGKYTHTFHNEEFGTQTHVIVTQDEGKVTVKGCASVNGALAEVGIGSNVRIVFKGKGKAKPGKRPPYLFETFLIEEDDADEAPKKAKKSQRELEETEDDSQEDDVSDSELPF